ncbi:TonB-dependent siderophore receptor, partial [Steroidobacter sp.]|uniref:TonB-dependent siderophore receptor n=1 Tax=Steroidobacter sp. TaxID=1978227 RepID=UPI001A3CABAB
MSIGMSRGRRFAIGGAVALLLAQAAWAQQVSFDVPAGEAAKIIPEFARQAQLQIIAPADELKGVRTLPLKGQLDVRAALKTLLIGTGLEIASDDGRIISLRKVKADPATADTGDAPTASVQTMEIITVFGRGAAGETVREVPQTVSVFNSEMLDIVAGATVQDAVRFIPSASNLIGDYSFTHNFNIRGFRTATTWNGMLPGIAAPGKVESANVERIEVLMGPAAVLYGAMEPGAVINVVTKQPLENFHAELNLHGGSFDTYGAAIDTGGPLGERTRARLNVSYVDGEAPFDYWSQKTLFVAPVVAFELGQNTRLTVEGSYRRSENPNGLYDGRVPVAGTLQSNPNGRIPLGFNSGYAPGITDSKDVWSSGNIRLQHDFSEALTLNAQVTYAKDDLTGTTSYPDPLNADDRTVSRLLVLGDQGQENTLAAISLVGRFNTGSLQHKVTGGVDHLDYDANTVYEVYTGAVPPLDVFAPNYALPGAASYFPFFFYRNSQQATAAFVQDQLSVGERWKFLAGVRYTDSTSDSVLNPPGQPIVELPDAKAQKWSTQFGVLYQLSDAMMLYANRTTSFQPRDAIVGRDGSLRNTPETATQYELGTRFDLLGSGLTANLALFRIEKPNVRITDPVDAFYQVDAGEVRSDGAELSVNGSLSPGWTVYAAYAYNETEVTKTTIPGAQGKQFANAPEHTLSLLSRYDIQSGVMQGLGASVAANYLGVKYADPANQLELPASTRIDLAIHYTFDNDIELSL